MSKCPEDYSTIKKEDLYNIFSKGILLQHDKVLLSFDGIGERNAMVSATMFSYKNSCPHEWKSLPGSSLVDQCVIMINVQQVGVVRGARLYDVIMIIIRGRSPESRGSGGSAPGSRVQGAAAPGRVQGAEPLAGFELCTLI
nr:protein kinase-like domain, phloem protein 2-like protein [Tanacetum cinerariifolium]